MLISKTLCAFALVAAALVVAAPAQAADPTVMASEIVEYRLVKWKTVHGEGDKAEKMVATLKKLRCEVKVGSHGGHTDISYRCAKWQKLALKDHDAAHQWQAWLKKYGFETKHAH
ncbi:hypothetical protein NHH03_07830 [Stieleria sp. TO1_6]|uniref:hypothetical protein n=1 Tax=Stieleria tagensis TaxID=2956795 RepID=UPI00209AFEA2|nr:hypothetical protein [Stieleria tagensis]MCO8121642.1 hypothetical protein [Stieleria tagensis]